MGTHSEVGCSIEGNDIDDLAQYGVAEELQPAHGWLKLLRHQQQPADSQHGIGPQQHAPCMLHLLPDTACIIILQHLAPADRRHLVYTSRGMRQSFGPLLTSLHTCTLHMEAGLAEARRMGCKLEQVALSGVLASGQPHRALDPPVQIGASMCAAIAAAAPQLRQLSLLGTAVANEVQPNLQLSGPGCLLPLAACPQLRDLRMGTLIPWGQNMQRTLQDLRALTQVTSLDLGFGPCRDDYGVQVVQWRNGYLDAVVGLTHLQRLALRVKAGGHPFQTEQMAPLLQRLRPLSSLQQLRCLEMHDIHARADAYELRFLSSLPLLTRVELPDCRISGDGVGVLARLPSLQVLTAARIIPTQDLSSTPVAWRTLTLSSPTGDERYSYADVLRPTLLSLANLPLQSLHTLVVPTLAVQIPWDDEDFQSDMQRSADVASKLTQIPCVMGDWLSFTHSWSERLPLSLQLLRAVAPCIPRFKGVELIDVILPDDGDGGVAAGAGAAAGNAAGAAAVPQQSADAHSNCAPGRQQQQRHEAADEHGQGQRQVPGAGGACGGGSPAAGSHRDAVGVVVIGDAGLGSSLGGRAEAHGPPQAAAGPAAPPAPAVATNGREDSPLAAAMRELFSGMHQISLNTAELEPAAKLLRDLIARDSSLQRVIWYTKTDDVVPAEHVRQLSSQLIGAARARGRQLEVKYVLWRTLERYDFDHY